MISAAARLLLVSLLVLTGCRTAKKAAVSTFRVIDAPARYLRERIDESDAATTTTTTRETPPVSDVVTPGRPITNPTPPPTTATARRQTAERRSPVTATPRPNADGTASAPQRKASTSSTPRPTASATSQFPIAKPVPGKPGYVYSVDPKGGIVDVTGYKSGDKAKDPYTQQIFIVP